MRGKKIKRDISSHAYGFSSIYHMPGENLWSCIIQQDFLVLPIDIGQVDLAQQYLFSHNTSP